MKNNEVKITSTKPTQVRTREQMEDKAFNKMLLWIAATIVVEVMMIQINRRWSGSSALHTLMPVLPVAGIVLFVLLLYWALRIKRDDSEHDGTAQTIIGTALLCVGLGVFVLQTFGSTAASVVLAVIPGLGVLAMVYYLYQKEFFCCAIVAGLGLLTLRIYRLCQGTGIYYALLILTVLVAIVGVVIGVKLMQKDGTLTIRGREVSLFPADAAYAAFFATACVSVLLSVAALALGSAVAYYAIWALVAWVFVLAVYFTANLM